MGTFSVSMAMLVVVLWWTLGVVPNAEATTEHSQRSTRQPSIPASFHKTMQHFIVDRQSFESNALERMRTSDALERMRTSFDKIVEEVFQYDMLTEFVMTLDRRITTLRKHSPSTNFELLAPVPATSPRHTEYIGRRNWLIPAGSYSDMLQKRSTNPTPKTRDVIAGVLDVIMRQHVDVLKHYRDEYIEDGVRDRSMCRKLHQEVQMQCDLSTRPNCTIPAAVVHLLTSDNSDRDKMHKNFFTQAFEVAVSIFVKYELDVIREFISGMAVRNAVKDEDIKLAKTYINLVMNDTIEQYKQDKKIFHDVAPIYFA